MPRRTGEKAKRESKHQTDSTGGTWQSVGSHPSPSFNIKSLLSFPPSLQEMCQSLSWQFCPTPPPPYQYLLNALVQSQFDPSPAPSSSLAASLEQLFQLGTVTSLCVEQPGIYLLETRMQMNARLWFIFAQRAGFKALSWRPRVAEQRGMCSFHQSRHTHRCTYIIATVIQLYS